MRIPPQPMRKNPQPFVAPDTSPPGSDFRRKNLRVLRPRVPQRSHQGRIRKSRGSKLIEEGHAFLRASDSGEPVGRIRPHVPWQWPAQD